MKNSETSPRGPGPKPPKESHLKPLLQEADAIKSVIGAIMVSNQRGRVD